MISRSGLYYTSFPEKKENLSYQGCQFTSDVYVDCIKNQNITISMNGKGRAIDNIFIECLWRSVKYEYVYMYAYETGTPLWSGLKAYFRFYNTKESIKVFNIKRHINIITPWRLENEDNFFDLVPKKLSPIFNRVKLEQTICKNNDKQAIKKSIINSKFVSLIQKNPS